MRSNVSIRSIAGYCNVYILWKLLVDLSSSLQSVERLHVLVPDSIIIDRENFLMLDGTSNIVDDDFYPPEGVANLSEAGVVWSLGALVCYASSGHCIFGGRGGSYQRSHPNVELPVLKKEHSELTPVVQRCLCHDPSQRIGLKELCSIAAKGLDICERKVRLIKKGNSDVANVTPIQENDIWPEKMG